jgi:hypothetical protein
MVIIIRERSSIKQGKMVCVTGFFLNANIMASPANAGGMGGITKEIHAGIGTKIDSIRLCCTEADSNIS